MEGKQCVISKGTHRKATELERNRRRSRERRGKRKREREKEKGKKGERKIGGGDRKRGIENRKTKRELDGEM